MASEGPGVEPEYDLPEVKDFDGTLAEAIASEVVPKPPICSWNDWQHWRRDYGKRPDVPMQPRERLAWFYKRESKLRKQILELTYGRDWVEAWCSDL